MKNFDEITGKDLTLDPQDWDAMRLLGHKMIDDMMDFLQQVHERPVWKKITPGAKSFLYQDVPQEPSDIAAVYHDFKEYVLPYTKGNIHPRFFAWVEGTGTPLGALSEFLGATMNPNVGIGEHSAMYVDIQVLKWCKQMMNYPEEASGILLSGASMANITALAVARNHQLGLNIRKEGLRATDAQMMVYCSAETHSCVQKAVEVLGLGTDSVRKIKVNDDYRINTEALKDAIENDLAAGLLPFCVIGNAGTVNTGAIDPLEEMNALCKKYNLWFHVDGAFGALAKLVPAYAGQLKAIEMADSVAFDLHKWMYMPYEIACVLIKNAEAHRKTFSITPSYLLQESRGLSGGPESANNFGMELSRCFKSLKVWMSLKEHGIKKYAAMIEQNIAQAFYFGHLVQQQKQLELMTPVTMNIVCYRFCNQHLSADELNTVNKEILIQLQEQGIASPSSTLLQGRFAIRVCIVNQRTKKSDLDLLLQETIRIGEEIIKQ